MSDFLAALGLFFAIEGICLAAFPTGAKRAMAAALTTPDGPLRVGGIVSALIGVLRRADRLVHPRLSAFAQRRYMSE